MSRDMMDDLLPNPALLPAGLRDLLPPEAETEAASVEALLTAFAAHGYQRVTPPLLEYEDSLLSGSGAAVADQTFRLMDPDTQRMIGLRADMTPQIARIAATRLVNAPRPLRLSYAGQCLRVRGTQLEPDRQVSQAGIELIGPDSPQADAETILVGAEALASVGLTRISIDVTLPPFVPTLLDEAGITGTVRQKLSHALDRKDTASVTKHGGPLAPLLNELLMAAGPAAQALEALARANLSPGAAHLAERLVQVVQVVQRSAPGLRLTIDPIECRSFRYHTGVYVTVYAAGRQEELGRGGRYICTGGEPATGLTLFPDAVLRAVPRRHTAARVFVPHGQEQAGVELRKTGFSTVAGLTPVADEVEEARRLLCTHVWREGVAMMLTPESSIADATAAQSSTPDAE